MLKDEIELITGRLISGPVTPAIFQLLKPSSNFEQICQDVKALQRRRSVSVNTSDTVSAQVENFGRGFDFLQWLSDRSEPVSLPGDGTSAEGPDESKR